MDEESNGTKHAYACDRERIACGVLQSALQRLLNNEGCLEKGRGAADLVHECICTSPACCC